MIIIDAIITRASNKLAMFRQLSELGLGGFIALGYFSVC
jgi:hypothetical protein